MKQVSIPIFRTMGTVAAPWGRHFSASKLGQAPSPGLFTIDISKLAWIKCAFVAVLTLPLWPCQAANSAASAIPAARAFNVWLDDRPMGQHRYSFASAPGEQQTDRDQLIVTSEANFDVKVLFVSVFSYDHTAIERWQGNCLRAVSSSTTTNGEEEQLELELPKTDCAGTYVYWDKERLQRATLTNAQTGEVEPAEWADRGMTDLPRLGKRKRVRPDQGPVNAVELRTPSAKFDLYYDTEDRLLMMQTDNDGRTITYLHDSLRVK